MLWIKDVQLASGSQSIVFELVGANDQARKFQNRGYLMGLDFLQLKPVEVAVVEQGSTSPKNVKVMEDASEEEQKPVEGGALTDTKLSKFTRDFLPGLPPHGIPEARWSGG